MMDRREEGRKQVLEGGREGTVLWRDNREEISACPFKSLSVLLCVCVCVCAGDILETSSCITDISHTYTHTHTHTHTQESGREQGKYFIGLERCRERQTDSCADFTGTHINILYVCVCVCVFCRLIM